LYSEKSIRLIETKRYPDAPSKAILPIVKIIYSDDPRVYYKKQTPASKPALMVDY